MTGAEWLDAHAEIVKYELGKTYRREDDDMWSGNNLVYGQESDSDVAEELNLLSTKDEVVITGNMVKKFRHRHGMTSFKKAPKVAAGNPFAEEIEAAQKEHEKTVRNEMDAASRDFGGVSTSEINATLNEGIDKALGRVPVASMSLRDWFAGMALSNALFIEYDSTKGETPIKKRAVVCYLLADAMMEAREK